jgi:hypothetical protein
VSVESELADYKRAFADIAVGVLKISQDMDNTLIPAGILLPEVAKLRIIAAQLTGASRGSTHPCAH